MSVQHDRPSRALRQVNTFEVLRQVFRAGSGTRQQLAEASSLSFATVAAVTSDLLDVGVLHESEMEASGGGRPRARLAVNPDRGVLLGIDVAETYVQVDLLDLALTLRGSVKQELDPESNHAEDVIALIAHGVRTVLKQTRTPRAQLLGAGVSVPGQVDRQGGVSVFAPNFAWHDVPFAKMLRRRIRTPLHLDNPLKASTVAELWFGAGRDVDDLVVLTIGTGVGAGIAVRGSLLRGTTNCAGEWGHTAIVLDGRLCRCGRRGCVEAYVGAPGIMEQLRELAPASALLHHEDQTLTITEIAGALDQQDETAEAVIAETARYLGVGIANLINTLNPQAIVVGGWVNELLGPWLIPAAAAKAARHTFDRTFTATRIQRSSLGRNPVGLGMATFALEGFLARLGIPSKHDPTRNAA